jgi:ribosomal protein S18 acetylase RimI-like enzyme
MGELVREMTMKIRYAVAEDLDAVKALADEFKHQLGFVRHTALERSIERSEILVAIERKKAIGFVEYHHRLDGQTTLYHIAVDKSSQGRGVGRALLERLYSEARANSALQICLKCPNDLPANEFYPRCQYRLQETLNGRKRPLNVWVRELETGNSD